jgi:hypothetical protein
MGLCEGITFGREKKKKLFFASSMVHWNLDLASRLLIVFDVYGVNLCSNGGK